MPRRLQGGTGGMVFHVMNRGAKKSALFTTTADYEAFFKTLREAAESVAMRILALVVMPNHWHLVLWPRTDGDLTKFVGWVSMTHACRWHALHETRGTGCVYQGRFKALPVESNRYLFIVIRYVERNPVRARLVERAEDWPWSSASSITGTDLPTLHPWPIPKPPHWLELVNEPEPAFALDELRTCVERSTPYGTDEWRLQTVDRLGWKTGMCPLGRPFAEPPEEQGSM